MDKKALDAGKQRAKEFLKTAASLGLKFPKAGQAVLRGDWCVADSARRNNDVDFGLDKGKKRPL